MGHKGSIKAKYTTNKSILSRELVDEMQDAFKRSQEFLDLERNIQQDEEIAKQKVVTSDEVEEFLKEGWSISELCQMVKLSSKNRARINT